MPASHLQRALKLFNALEQLREITLAKAAAAASLLHQRRAPRVPHRISNGVAQLALAADALDDLHEHRRPV